jgi:hypothetical protein
MKLPVTLLPSLASLCLVAAAHAGTALPAPKGVEAAIAPAPDATSTVLGLGLNTNDNMTEGSAFLVQPLWDNLGQHGTMGGSLFFAEPYFTWGEEGELTGSIGLGFRHLFSNEPVGGGNRLSGLLAEGLFVGANVFTDYQHTPADADLWQLGIGVEAGTRYLEVRANYYLPLHDGDTVGSFDATTLTPTTSGGRPAIRATTRTIDIIEEPMEGWDAELAVLIPGLDKYFDMRLIGGYYSFETNASGNALLYSADVEGWKAGVEVRPVPAVVLAGMWYEDENLVEDNWMVSVRLEIPLGKPGSESFTPRRRHLQERLLEPVHRQNAAIQTGVSFEPTGRTHTKTITTAQQAQRFLNDLKGWGASYGGSSSSGSSSSPSSSSSSSGSTGGTLVIAGPSSGSGATVGTISGGSLDMGTGGSTGGFTLNWSDNNTSAGAFLINRNSAVRISGGPTFIGVIPDPVYATDGTLNLIKTGTGTLNLNSSNSGTTQP